MYTVQHDKITGRFLGIAQRNADGSDTFFGPGSRLWQDFLEWNASQPVQLDLSDKPPPPPPVDTDLNAIDALIAKDDGGTATNAEKVELVLRAVKRLRRRGAL
jgi:hypothetical protein